MGKTILIVDDTLAIIEYIKEALTSSNSFFKFIVAHDGHEAYNLAKENIPDVVIINRSLPVMSGVEVLIRIKRNPSTKDIPVIVTTTQTSHDKLQSLIDNKAFNYIKKPINTQELLVIFNNALILSNALQKLKEHKQTLFAEKQKSESILKALLPAKIIHDIKKTGYSSPKKYQDVVVIFIDLVDFTSKTTTMSPRRLIKELGEIYSAYDEIISKCNCTRIKTIGDAYLATCGLPNENKDAILTSAKAALEVRNYIINRNMSSPVKWSIRIGMYYGDVIGSLVSSSNYTFDIFGNTVNTAARYQSMCDPMQINIPKSMKDVLQDKYKIVERLPRKVKGKGLMPMYYLHNPLPTINIPKKEDVLHTNKLCLMY